MAQRPALEQLPFAAPAKAKQVNPEAMKDFAVKGQAKHSTLPAQTERGEASLAMAIAPSSITRPSGITHKNKLAMAGQNIVGDNNAKKYAENLHARTEEANTATQRKFNQMIDKFAGKNPFSQKRPTFGQGSVPGNEVRVEEDQSRDGAENSDDSDDFNEFYMKNNPRFAGAFTGVDSSISNSLQQTAGQNNFNMYNTAADEAGRGSFNQEEFGQ